MPIVKEGQPPGAPPTPTSRTDAQVEQLLRGLAGAARVTAVYRLPVPVIGQTQPLTVNFVRGDYNSMGYQGELTAGRWMTGPDQTVVPSALMRERGLRLGDRLTLAVGGRQTVLTVAGETMDGPGAFADWRVLTGLAGPRRPAGRDVLPGPAQGRWRRRGLRRRGRGGRPGARRPGQGPGQ
jgi:putative ABC transport system permease protein